MNETIPARIIQTGKTRDLPPLAKAAVVNIKCLNPAFEYLFFDDDEVSAFVAKEFPQYRDVFEAFPFRIQKYDFFRYLAILRFGGFYFDLDVFLSEDLSPLLSHSAVFPFEELTLSRYLRDRHGMDWELGNYAFGAAAGHPFLEAVIENCVKAQRNTDWVRPMMAGIPRIFQPDFFVLNTTGPGLLSRSFAENPDFAAAVTILFGGDVCESANWHKFGTYGIHLMNGSWRTRGGFLRRRLAWWWESRSKARLMPASVKLGPRRDPRSARGVARATLR